MSRMSNHHKELTDGVGRCSVPMWINGLPAEFCDKSAYGFRPECDGFRTAYGELVRHDSKYSGYIPGLACPTHGGPEGASISKYIDIVFDGPPAPESGRFVEVENPTEAIEEVEPQKYHGIKLPPGSA